jgi:hypothetical protein
MKKENIGVRKDEKPVKGETFRVNFSQASDARELDELIDHIHETLGTRTRPDAAMKMAYLARRQLDLMATGIMPGSQYAPMFNAMNKCLFEGTLSAFLIVRDVIEGIKRGLYGEMETMRRDKDEMIRKLQTDIENLRYEMRFLEAFVTVLRNECPGVSEIELVEKARAYFTAEKDKVGSEVGSMQ